MAETTHVDEQDLAQPKTFQQYLRLFFSGFVMGSADIVPGVSGGTMAFIGVCLTNETPGLTRLM
jgi:hypothetical protein